MNLPAWLHFSLSLQVLQSSFYFFFLNRSSRIFVLILKIFNRNLDDNQIILVSGVLSLCRKIL